MPENDVFRVAVREVDTVVYIRRRIPPPQLPSEPYHDRVALSRAALHFGVDVERQLLHQTGWITTSGHYSTRILQKMP